MPHPFCQKITPVLWNCINCTKFEVFSITGFEIWINKMPTLKKTSRVQEQAQEEQKI